MFAPRLRLVITAVATLALAATTLVAPVQAAWCCCSRMTQPVEQAEAAAPPASSCCHAAVPAPPAAAATVPLTVHGMMQGHPCTCDIRHQKTPAQVNERLLPSTPDHVAAWLGPSDDFTNAAPRDGRVTAEPLEARAAGPTLQTLYCVWRK